MQDQENITAELLKFGEHLKKLREEKGKSLNIFAYENDMAKSTVSRIERGKVDFRYSHLVKIAKALDISLYELFNFDNDC